MEKNLREKYKEIWQIVGGYFHQDVESMEKGYDDLMKGTSADYKKEVIDLISKFVKDIEFSIEEKNLFIKNNNSFVLHKEPIIWLQDLSKKIEDHLRQK